MARQRPRAEKVKVKVKPMSRTTLYLEADLYKAIRIAAIEDGVAVSHLFDQLAREYIKKRNRRELAYALGEEPPWRPRSKGRRK